MSGWREDLSLFTHLRMENLCQDGEGSVPFTHLRVEKQGDVTRLHLLSPPVSTLSCVLLGRVAQGAPGVHSPALCPAREKLAPSLDATWVSSLLPEAGRGSGVSSGRFWCHCMGWKCRQKAALR